MPNVSHVIQHAVVWIDHREARVFHFDREGASHVVIHPDNPTVHLHHKANCIGSGNAPEDQNYFHSVALALAGIDKVLITGPASAKTELMKHIHRDEKSLVDHIAGIETVDHPTDKELVAHARAYFKADHQVLPRSP